MSAISSVPRLIAETPPAFLRDREVARELGLSKTKAYLMMRSGEIPGVVRFGRSIRVHRDTLLAWAAERSRAA